MCVFFSLLSRPPFVSDSQENKASGGKQTIPGTSFGPSIILGARQTPGKYSGIKHRLPLRERSGTPAIEQAKPKVWSLSKPGERAREEQKTAVVVSAPEH